ncbi:proprotein convertase P-domain-containing protein, partial [Streptomyces sp. NPDC059656]
ASAVAANGTWKLKVQDKGAADVGTITDFKLTF